MTGPQPPIAKIIPTERSHHGDTVLDPYAWLHDRNDPDTIPYLAAENEYTEAATAGQAQLREQVYDEISARTQQTDLSVPARRGGYWYYRRTEEGKQYGSLGRRPVAAGEVAPPSTGDGRPLDGEQILLDGNVLAGDSEFLSVG
ncbi:MAG: oligopeptidase, partial [Mycobacteriales bacterium]